MNTAHSKDGTPLAYDRFGKAPALILVNGAMATRTDATKTAESLGQHFTVFAYDRRGRGKSFPFLPEAAQTLTEILPNAQYRHFSEQDHSIKDDILVPTLVEFFLGEIGA